MNTSDIRDTETTQVVFWLVALPLTATLITLCLVYTGKLQNVMEGFDRVWSAFAAKRQDLE